MHTVFVHWSGYDKCTTQKTNKQAKKKKKKKKKKQVTLSGLVALQVSYFDVFIIKLK